MEKENQNRTNADNVIEEVFPVEGMSCGGCANGVKRSLGRLEGVKSAEVSLSESSVRVAYDPGAVTPAQMQRAVEAIGFKLGGSQD